MKGPSSKMSRRHHIICPFCESGELISVGPGAARCRSCGLPLLGSTLETLQDVVGLPDTVGAHACDCGHPEMRELPDRVFHCPACGSEVLPMEASSGVERQGLNRIGSCREKLVREVKRRLFENGPSRATGEVLAAKYDETAERRHDRVALLGYSRAREDLFDRLLATGTLRSLWTGGRVLDLGLGSAASSLALARKVTAPLRIEVVALSPSMLLRVPRPGPRGHRESNAPVRC